MSQDRYGLRKMSDRQLEIWVGGWKQETDKYVAGVRELARRDQAPVRRWTKIGFAVALASLVVSVLIALRIYGLV